LFSRLHVFKTLVSVVFCLRKPQGGEYFSSRPPHQPKILQVSEKPEFQPNLRTLLQIDLKALDLAGSNMRITVQPNFRKERISLDPNYNESVENVLVQCSLQISEVPITELALYFQDKALAGPQRLDQVGVTDGAQLDLRQRQASCCGLL